MFMGAFFIYLFSYLIILVIQKHNKHIPERINYNTLINSRLYIGMAVILIPMLFCTLLQNLLLENSILLLILFRAYL